MSAEKLDGMIDRLRPSDVNMSFKLAPPPLSLLSRSSRGWSLRNIVDRDMDARHFFVSTVATCYSRDRLM